MIITKRVDLPLLTRELATAGVAVPNGLGTSGTATADPEDLTQDLYTYDAQGVPSELPVEAVPVVEAHVAPPLVYEYAATLKVGGLAHTTNDTPTEIYRLTLGTSHIYEASLSVLGTDPARAVYATSRRYVVKRITGAALLVGEAPLTDIPDPAAADWDVVVRVAGNDAIVEVIGERTGPVDWVLYGEIAVFAPGGLA